ncbi:MAG: type VI secretion system baseplate subunit TssG [Pyrinomonadaceae bacterium]|nr:type VI secretion system baseplate subunit TssG [Pyrinomonadaceae bacterium]
MQERTLKDNLFEEPYRFEFFQAARLVELINSEKRRVGGGALPGEEAVRFRSRVTLDFPSSEVHQILEQDEAAGDAPHLEMHVNFMGLVGPSGVLPVHYTELVLDRIRHRDTSMWAFLDIFTHRIVSMFYRAWAKYRFPVAYERGEDEFTSYLFDFAGLGTRGLQGRMGLEDESLLPYVGLISQKPHSASAVSGILADYFGVGAKIEQFYGQWLELTTEDVTHLGKANSTLGYTALIGARVWDQQSKFRVVLGKMSFAKFQAFLPSGSAYKSLQSIIRFLCGPEFDLDVKLKLEAKQVPSLVLTTRAVRRPQLGWTTWLKSKPFKHDDEQVVLSMN